MKVCERARLLGIEACREFDPGLLIPQQRIREFCHENKCGNYGRHYMCPPYVGSLEEIEAKLRRFQRGILLQYSQRVDVRNDMHGVKRTKVDFHRKVLELEQLLRNEGTQPTWGMIGGSCALCDICTARTGEPCPYPHEARTSLESLGIDVTALLRRLGLDGEFHPDRIARTGCVLF